MKNTFKFLFLMFLLSCSSDDDFTSTDESSSKNKLEIDYLGYLEAIFDEGSKLKIFENVEITRYTEKISETEEIKLLKVKAVSKENSSEYIIFNVLDETIGDNALYNNLFTFRLGWPTYTIGSSKINLKVMTNNSTEFSAEFSGELEHWNDRTKVLQILKIHQGDIFFEY